MLTDKIVERIILEAISAPSGDNCQPWQFVVNKNKIEIFDIPGIDNEIYNFKNRGSYIAHGALIENISIVSAHFGFETEVFLFPDAKKTEYIASIVFTGKPGLVVDLYPAVARRATNRKKYYSIPLAEEDKKSLLSSILENEGRIVLVEDQEAKKRLAKALVVSERLMLENKAIHDYLFSNICWTREESELKRSGLYAVTLELAPPKLFVFRKCQNWMVAKFLSAFGMSRAIASDNAKLYSSSPALGAILIKNQEIIDYVNSGRLMQRFWLRATLLGIYMQPIAAIPYIAQRFVEGNTANFSPAQVDLVKNAYRVIQDELSNFDETVAIVFRIGKAPPPSALSPRCKPKIIFQP